jgi:ketosteroid isomerase-like protein
MSGQALRRRGGALLAALGVLWLTGCCCMTGGRWAYGVDGRQSMRLAEREIRDETNRFIFALDSMFTGDLLPLGEVWSHADDVTLMSPYGGRAVGWRAVHDQMLRESRAGMSGNVAYTDLLVRVGPDCRIAWTVGRIVGEGFRRNGLPVNLDVRATAIWRREGGHWRLVHLQTDPFAASTPEPVEGRTSERMGTMGQRDMGTTVE